LDRDGVVWTGAAVDGGVGASHAMIRLVGRFSAGPADDVFLYDPIGADPEKLLLTSPQQGRTGGKASGAHAP
jgi:hypothetical protein